MPRTGLKPSTHKTKLHTKLNKEMPEPIEHVSH